MRRCRPGWGIAAGVCAALLAGLAWAGDLADAAIRQAASNLQHRLDAAGLRYNYVEVSADRRHSFGGKGRWAAVFERVPTEDELGTVLRLQRLGFQSHICHVTSNGQWGVNMAGATNTDLSALRGLPLEGLDITCAPVTNLSPLQGLPLKYLSARGSLVSDLSPLKGAPLQELGLTGTRVSSLAPLAGLRLVNLDVAETDVSDLSPLRGMPLERLDVALTAVSDLTPLEGMPLQMLCFSPDRITRGLEGIRAMPSLRRLGIAWGEDVEAAEFWKQYDAGTYFKPGKAPRR